MPQVRDGRSPRPRAGLGLGPPGRMAMPLFEAEDRGGRIGSGKINASVLDSR